MKSKSGNIMGYYPMIRNFINGCKSGERKPFAKISLPLLQKVQNTHMKRRWRIKQKHAAGVYSSEVFRFELKAAQLHMLNDFTEAMEISLKRYEKYQQGQVPV